MAKPSALLLLLLSCLSLSGCSAQGKYLSEEEVADPDFISSWLQTHDAGPELDEAKFFLDLAQKEKQRRNWSAASKAFGEAMIRYPSPTAVAGYADSMIQMLGQIRARDETYEKHSLADLQRMLNFYKSAAAADGILNSLGNQENALLQSKVDCITGFVESKSTAASCDPLKLYFGKNR